MEYFVRAMETNRDSSRTYQPEVVCPGLSQAKAEAKRQVMESKPEQMLLADACVRRGGIVVTKYRCRLDARGDLHEYDLL